MKTHFTLIDGTKIQRLKWLPDDPQNICHDCGAKPGEYHDEGCDMEDCPICKMQYISCNCPYPNEEDMSTLPSLPINDKSICYACVVKGTIPRYGCGIYSWHNNFQSAAFNAVQTKGRVVPVKWENGEIIIPD